MTEPLGIWIIGAQGGVGTTMVVGARAIAKGLVSDAGLVTTRPEFGPLNLVGIEDLVFGGHEVRVTNYYESAREIYKRSRSIDYEVIEAVKEDLLDISEALKPGTVINSGAAIRDLATNPITKIDEKLRSLTQQIQSDIRAFRAREGIEDVVVVNLASTEPELPSVNEIPDPAAFERILDENRADLVRPSMLYAYSAFKEGCGYINFTPSMAALCPVMCTIAEECGVPYMGSDGKTGETLVKSALAPMFKYRNLQVLAWQGYNMLGDRDGEVLAHSENLEAKLRSKDTVVPGILGYDCHTKVGIDYVESLDDLKTAWDFIHFKGFLDHKMSMSFTWQGCDSILAAPLVLDMVGLTELAMRRGEKGPMTHLAPYFKSPLGASRHDLHGQFHEMMDYFAGLGVNEPGG